MSMKRETEDKEALKKEKAAMGAQEYADLPQAFETPELEEGETVYLINRRWFDDWKSYAQESNDIHSGAPYAYFTRERPGEIENDKLFDPKTERLRPNMYDRVDYCIVKRDTWEYLLDKYGGGPEVTRSVIKSSYGKPTVEVYMKEIWYITAERKEKKPLVISKSKTYRDLKALLCEELALERERAMKQMKLYSWYDAYDIESSDVGSEILFEENDKLDGYAIGDKSIIFVDPYGDYKKKSSYTLPNTNGISSIYSSSSLFSSSYFPTTATPSYSVGTASSSTYFSSSGSTSITSTALSYQGASGLDNLGNTCYMNAGLQCLLNTPPLKEYFQSGKWKADLNAANPIGTGGELAAAYSKLVSAMSDGAKGSVNPRELKDAVGKHCAQFSGFQQQDSHEFLTVLLDYLHEDLNRVKEKPYTEEGENGAQSSSSSSSSSAPKVDGEGASNAKLAEAAWSKYLARNQSEIVDLFYGQLKSTLKCPDCGKVSTAFDSFSSLSLPLDVSCNTSGEIEEKRELTVTVVREPGAVQKYKMRVFGSDTLNDCAEALAEADAFPAAGQEVFFYTVNKDESVFDKQLSGETPIKSLRQKHVYLYVVTPERAEGKKAFYIPVYTRLHEGKLFSSSPKFVGMPYLMEAFAGDSPLSLYANVFERFVVPFLINADDATKKVEVKLTKDLEAKPKQEVDLAHAKDKDLPPPLEEGAYKAVIINVKTSSKREFETIVKSNELFPDAMTTKQCMTKSVRRGTEGGEKEGGKRGERRDYVTLEECVRMFETPEKLNENDMWYCPVCKAQKQAVKTMTIWRLPRVLVFHLKRFLCMKSKSKFHSFQNYNEKLDTLVKSPMEGLTMYEYMDKESPFREEAGNFEYRMFGTVNHMGTLNSGHYVAYAKGGPKDEWMCFNDSHVSGVDAKSVVSDKNYILFYIKQDDDEEEEEEDEEESSEESSEEGDDDDDDDD